MTAGALLAEWELMEFVCQQNELFFSQCLRESLKARKRIILQNDAFLGAVYVDLRHNRLLSSEQKELAKKHMFLTRRKLVHLNESQELSMISPTSSSYRNLDSTNPNLLQTDLLEAILIQKDSEITENEKSTVRMKSLSQVTLLVFLNLKIFSSIGPNTSISN